MKYFRNLNEGVEFFIKPLYAIASDIYKFSRCRILLLYCKRIHSYINTIPSLRILFWEIVRRRTIGKVKMGKFENAKAKPLIIRSCTFKVLVLPSGHTLPSSQKPSNLKSLGKYDQRLANWGKPSRQRGVNLIIELSRDTGTAPIS